MNTSDKELEQRLRRFEAQCREAGVKVTHQRLEIYRELARSGDHPDAETLFRRVRERLSTVSLDTVYRTLWLLKDMGLIDTLGPPRERARFDANLARHHHFVCASCGLTQDFYSDALDALKLPSVVETYGEVCSTHVEVRGVCRRCGAENTGERSALKTNKKKTKNP